MKRLAFHINIIAFNPRSSNLLLQIKHGDSMLLLAYFNICFDSAQRLLNICKLACLRFQHSFRCVHLALGLKHGIFQRHNLALHCSNLRFELAHPGFLRLLCQHHSTFALLFRSLQSLELADQRFGRIRDCGRSKFVPPSQLPTSLLNIGNFISQNLFQRVPAFLRMLALCLQIRQDFSVHFFELREFLGHEFQSRVHLGQHLHSDILQIKLLFGAKGVDFGPCFIQQRSYPGFRPRMRSYFMQPVL
mmetsp:Transcript_12892/g.22110  ORF Transcript_12892/g.22110 Transcript_12892/m.22110 type:complete len:247 (-) Transcript_12892:499-1239(-)